MLGRRPARDKRQTELVMNAFVEGAARIIRDLGRYAPLLALGVIAFGCLIAIFTPAGLGWDFANFYDAGHKALVGETHNLFDEHALIDGEAPQSNMPFLSAPVSSYFYVGLALFDPEMALVLFKAENALAIALALAILHFSLLVHVAPEDRHRFTTQFLIAAVLFQPFWTVFRVGGQVTPTILLLLAAGLVLHAQARFFWSAACMAMIVLMKPVFIPGAVFLALASGKRFFLAASLIGGLVAAFSIGLMGLDVHLALVARMAFESGRLWPSQYNSALTSSLDFMLPPVCEPGPASDALCRAHPTIAALSSVLRAGAVLSLILVFVAAARSGISDQARRHFAWMIAAILPMMATPIVWAHYLSAVFLLIAFALATQRHFPRPAMALIAAIVLLSVGQNLIIILEIVRMTGMDQPIEKVGMGVFKSLPLWLTLAFLVLHRRAIFSAYHAPGWSDAGGGLPLTGVAARLAADPRMRFIAAGGALAAMNWLLRFPLSLALPYEAAVVAAAAAMIAIGFFLYRGYVFAPSSRSVRWQMTMFFVVSFVGVGVTTLVAAEARDIFQHRSLLRAADAEAFGHIFGIGAAAIWNFLGHRHLTFGRAAG